MEPRKCIKIASDENYCVWKDRFMHAKETSRFTWQGFILVIALVALAVATRLWPLQDLGTRVTYTTFYPAVMIAALYGGLATGLLGMFFSCLMILFVWSAFVGEPVIKDFADWLGMAVFALNCTMISGIAQAMQRSRSRSAQVQLELERSNASLQAARNALENEVKRRTAELMQSNISLQKELTERKRAEQALRETEERFRLFMNNSPAIAWMKDEQGRYVYMSETYENRFGVRLAECYGKTHFDLWPKEIAEQFSKSDRAVLSSGQPIQIFDETVNPDGARCYWWKFKFAIVSSAGMRYVGGIGVDITALKEAEQEREITIDFLHLVNECRGAEDLIRSATSFFHQRSGCDAVGIRLPEGDDYPYFQTRGFPEEFVRLENHLCTYDGNGRARLDRTGNPLLACMCGNVIRGQFDPLQPFFTERGSFWTNSTTELLASTTEEGILAETRDRCNREGYESVALIALRSGDKPWGLLQLNDRRKGRFTSEIIALWERLAQHMSVALAKFQAEEALREAKDHLEARVKERTAEVETAKEAVTVERRRLYDVLETLPVYVCLLDSDYRMPFANRYFRETFGESQGNLCHEFLFNRTGPCETCETYTVMKTRAPHHWYWTGPNGRDYDIYDFPFIDTDGSFLILEMGIDITERKQAEDALRKTLADLTRSNADLEHFAYIASHDLQEPLRNVASALQILEKSYKGKLSSDADQLIYYAVDAAQRMRNLIADLLKYSRLATQNQPFEQVNIQEVVSRSILNLKTLIEQKGAAITCEKMPTLRGDSTQLVQVFQNLIGNAVKFSRTESPKVRVTAQRKGNEWVFSVEDNGIGIDERHFERIFVIFQQLSKRGSFGGTGMGLAIVKKIVERHSGRVWVESEVGVGSTFSFTIPDGPAAGHDRSDAICVG